jgi:solute:Na+ symporter, SSS family
MSVVDYLVIIGYFLVVIVVGYLGLRRARNVEDYLVAGRSLGPPMYVGTLSALVLGGASTVGGVSLGYQYGISGMWLVIMLSLGLLALALLFTTRLANLGVYTVAEVLDLRYGDSARLITAVIVTAYALMLAVTQTIAVGTLFDVTLGVPRTWAILIAGGIVVLYSVAGGMWSITLTDFLQFCVMTVGVFFVLLPVALFRVGGLSGLSEELPASYLGWTSIGWTTIFAYFLLFFFGIMIGQDIWQRVFTARSPTVARWGGTTAAFYCAIYGFTSALIGTAAAALFPNLATPDNAFAQLATNLLPIGLAGLVVAAALAAIMSTASSALLAAATVAAEDGYVRFFGGRGSEERNELLVNRISTLVVGVVVIGIALVVRDVVGALTVAYDLLVGALFVPIVGAFFWRRATGAGALISMAVSSVVVVVLLLWRGLLSNDPIIYGLLTSLIVFVAASLLTRKPSERHMKAWEERLVGEEALQSSEET